MSELPGQSGPQGPVCKPKKNPTTWDDLKEQAKKSCKRCYGRGYLGKFEDGSPLFCSCVTRNIAPAGSEIKKLNKSPKWRGGLHGVFDTSLVG